MMATTCHRSLGRRIPRGLGALPFLRLLRAESCVAGSGSGTTPRRIASNHSLSASGRFAGRLPIMRAGLPNFAGYSSEPEREERSGCAEPLFLSWLRARAEAPADGEAPDAVQEEEEERPTKAEGPRGRVGVEVDGARWAAEAPAA